MPCARFVSVSELLGDADQRYFSAGYRAVRQDLRGIRLYTDDHGAIRVGASLALSYPQSWSQKAGQEDRRPHLSTLDALLVASQLTEVILLEALSLPRELRQWVWIRRAVIRAGAKAVEELDDVEVRGQLISGDAELSPLFRHTRLVKTRFSNSPSPRASDSGIALPLHLNLVTAVVPCTAGVIGALANAGHQAAYLFGVAVVGMGGNSIACHWQRTRRWPDRAIALLASVKVSSSPSRQPAPEVPTAE